MSRMSAGNLFHSVGAATANELSCSFVRGAGTSRRDVSDDDRSVLAGAGVVSSSARYRGWDVDLVTYVRMHSLKPIRSRIGNQWRLSRADETHALNGRRFTIRTH